MKYLSTKYSLLFKGVWLEIAQGNHVMTDMNKDKRVKQTHT